MCLICMKYRIIILIIIIISLGKILVSCIAIHITHVRPHARTPARMHARTHARTHAPTNARTRARTHARTHEHTRSPPPTTFAVRVGAPNHDGVMVGAAGRLRHGWAPSFSTGETMADRQLIEINNARATRYSLSFGWFFALKKIARQN